MFHKQKTKHGQEQPSATWQPLPLQPLPLEEPVVVHAVEVVCEGRHTQVVVDQSANDTMKSTRGSPSAETCSTFNSPTLAEQIHILYKNMCPFFSYFVSFAQLVQASLSWWWKDNKINKPCFLFSYLSEHILFLARFTFTAAILQPPLQTIPTVHGCLVCTSFELTAAKMNHTNQENGPQFGFNQTRFSSRVPLEYSKIRCYEKMAVRHQNKNKQIKT